MQGGSEEEAGAAYNRLLGLLSDAGVVAGQRHDREKRRGVNGAASTRQSKQQTAGDTSRLPAVKCN